jgi:hypothetical protein
MPRTKVQGRVLSETELANLRRQIEDFDTIEVISPEMRELIERAFPDLVHKLPRKSWARQRSRCAHDALSKSARKGTTSPRWPRPMLTRRSRLRSETTPSRIRTGSGG